MKFFRALLCAVLLAFQLAPVFAGINNPGSGSSLSPQTKRSVFNLQIQGFWYDYAFINFFQEGESMLQPFGSSFSSGTPIWNSGILDAQGWPCTNAVNVSCPYAGATNPAQGSNGFGGGINIPAGTSYSGVYCFQGLGSGTAQFNVGSGSGTLSAAAGQACANFNSGSTNCDGVSHFTNSGTVSFSGGNKFVTTDEHWAGWCFAVTWTGTRAQFNVEFTLDDPSNSGHYVKGVQFYQQSDGPDLVGSTARCSPYGGCIFRAGWKQPIVTQDPGYVRTMNLIGGNSSGDMSFLDRRLPTVFGYGSFINPNSLPYGVSTGTNAITVAAVTGTPVSMTHGEFVSFRAGGTQTVPDGQFTVTSITVPVAGTVDIVTSSANGFSLNDVVALVPNALGTNVLNYFNGTITSIVSATEFKFSHPNTGAITTCASSGACAATMMEVMTLNVGSRGAFPIMFGTGNVYGTYSGTFTTGSYYQYCFNKNLPGNQDGSNHYTYGIWVPCNSNKGWPLEWQAQLINELNRMGPTFPIHLWMVIPSMAITCNTFYCDPDATVSTEWPANVVKVTMNGANGYLGLQSPAQLVIQGGGNELWNSAFTQSVFLKVIGWYRWGHNNNDFDSFSEFLSLEHVTDIKQAGYSGSSRVHFVDGGWFSGGSTVGTYNYDRITGNGLDAGFATDPANPMGAVAPITYYDYGYAVAPYVAMSPSSLGTNIGTATSPGTTVTQWITDVQSGGYSGTAAQTDLTTGIGLIQNDGCSNCNTIASSETQVLAVATLANTGTVNNAGTAYSKNVVQYEGFVCGNNDARCGWTMPSEITGLSCAAGVATFTVSNNFISGQQVAVDNISVVGYNTVVTVSVTGLSGSQFETTSYTTCPAGTPSATNWQGGYGSVIDVVSYFNIQMYESSGFATTFKNFFSNMTSGNPTFMPSIYVELGGTWGMAYPDTYGATATEGNGLWPVWTAVGTYNSGQAN